MSENSPPIGELTDTVVAIISDIRKERDRALKEVIPLRRALRDLIVSADRVRTTQSGSSVWIHKNALTDLYWDSRKAEVVLNQVMVKST
ncbi:MAG: hypothetical protein GY811_06905 [Myxococcales bacterium]|nr:hypothetical protein [Myxococcales bacterium]